MPGFAEDVTIDLSARRFAYTGGSNEGKLGYHWRFSSPDFTSGARSSSVNTGIRNP